MSDLFADVRDPSRSLWMQKLREGLRGRPRRTDEVSDQVAASRRNSPPIVRSLRGSARNQKPPYDRHGRDG